MSVCLAFLWVETRVPVQCLGVEAPTGGSGKECNLTNTRLVPLFVEKVKEGSGEKEIPGWTYPRSTE